MPATASSTCRSQAGRSARSIGGRAGGRRPASSASSAAIAVSRWRRRGSLESRWRSVRRPRRRPRPGCRAAGPARRRTRRRSRAARSPRRPARSPRGAAVPMGRGWTFAGRPDRSPCQSRTRTRWYTPWEYERHRAGDRPDHRAAPADRGHDLRVVRQPDRALPAPHAGRRGGERQPGHRDGHDPLPPRRCRSRRAGRRHRVGRVRRPLPAGGRGRRFHRDAGRRAVGRRPRPRARGAIAARPGGRLDRHGAHDHGRHVRAPDRDRGRGAELARPACRRR